MPTSTRLACVALLLLAAGCEGPAGEPGATGVQGPQGDPDARDTRPVIFSVSPDVVSTNTIVTITGANFDPDGGTEVWVDGFAARLVESSPTSLKVTGLAPESPKEKFSALTVISRGETSNAFLVHVVPWGHTRPTRLPVPSGWSASVLQDKTPGREIVRLFEHDGAILDIDVRSGTSTLVAQPGTLPFLRKATIGADGRTYALRLNDDMVVAIEGDTFWPRDYQSWGPLRLRDFAVGSDGSVYGLTDLRLERMLPSGDRMTVYSGYGIQVQVTSERVYLLTGSSLLVYSTSDHSLVGEIPVTGHAFALTSDAIVIFHFPETGSVFDLASLDFRRDLSGLPGVTTSAGGQVIVVDDAWIFDMHSRLELVEDPFGEGKKSDAMRALGSCARDVTRGRESSSVWIANYGALFEVSAPDVAHFFSLVGSFARLAATPSGTLYIAGVSWDIQRFNPASRTSESVPSDTVPGYSTGGIISPSDGNIYYAFRNGDDADGIAMYDEQRDESRVITTLQTYVDRASFAAFGEELFFVSDGDLWTVPMSGGPPNRETSGGLARSCDSMETSRVGHLFWNNGGRLFERSPSGDMRWTDDGGGGIVLLPTEELLLLSCVGPPLILSR